ncbi:MAG: hypothetical protein JWR04_2042 [Rhodoglobus sp.]|nr:hypothetical protein [Rhodoglobus sp.]
MELPRPSYALQVWTVGLSPNAPSCAPCHFILTCVGAMTTLGIDVGSGNPVNAPMSPICANHFAPGIQWLVR